MKVQQILDILNDQNPDSEFEVMLVVRDLNNQPVYGTLVPTSFALTDKQKRNDDDKTIMIVKHVDSSQ